MSLSKYESDHVTTCSNLSNVSPVLLRVKSTIFTMIYQAPENLSSLPSTLNTIGSCCSIHTGLVAAPRTKSGKLLHHLHYLFLCPKYLLPEIFGRLTPSPIPSLYWKVTLSLRLSLSPLPNTYTFYPRFSFIFPLSIYYSLTYYILFLSILCVNCFPD